MNSLREKREMDGLATDFIEKATNIMQAVANMERDVTAGIVLIQSLDELKQTIECEEASSEYKAAAVDLACTIADSLKSGLDRFSDQLRNGQE